MSNTITISGYAGNHPERFEYKEGKYRCVFSMAHTHARKIGGELKTTWFNVTVFGQQAETLCDFIKKGDKIQVTGEMSCYPYKGKDGQEKKGYPAITTFSVYLGQKKNSSASSQQNGYQEHKQTTPAKTTNSEELPFVDDDIPF